MELAILVPVLRRPHRVKPLVDSIRASVQDWCRVFFLCDAGDEDEIQAVRERIGRYDYLELPPGTNYAQKINTGIRCTTEPLIFLGADDLNFHPGWFEAAKRKLSPPVGVVGTQDLCNARTIRGEHSTHCLVARWYAEQGTIDEPDKLLHERYPHEFVDDELVETAKYRGAWAFAEDSIAEHLHPDANKAPTDPLYDARPIRMRQGRRIYLRRRHLWARTG